MAQRLRIAFLIDQLEFDQTYPNLLVREALRAAEQRNCDLLVVPGREWGVSFDQEGMYTSVYRLLPQFPLDAVILSPAVSNLWPEEQLLRGAQSLAPLPLISMVAQVGTSPRVILDSSGALGDLIRHLIQKHGRRRIACLRGPRNHEAATDRFQAWKSTLIEQGLTPDDDLVAEVEFKESGVGKVLNALIDRAGPIDAVVAASDLVAMAAITALQRRGLRVPEDVSVVGYDNIPLAAEYTPPLTTVDHALADQVDAAFALALQRPPKPASDVTLRARAVLRRSCGCHQESLPAGKPEIPVKALLRRLERLTTFHLGLGQHQSEHELYTWLGDQLPRQGFDNSILLVGHVDAVGNPETELLPAPTNQTPVLGSTIDSLWSRDRRTRAALPLASGRHWFGLLILDFDMDGALIYRGLQEALTRRFRDDYERKVLVGRSVEEETAKRIEQEKMRSLGTLVAGLAHEVNTPLGIAITASSFLETTLEKTPGAMTSDVREALDLMNKNLARAADLVTRFKRLSVERTRVSHRSLDLTTFLADLRSSLAFGLRQAGIELSLNVEPQLTVRTSSATLFDIFTNLAQNIIDHAFPQGGRDKEAFLVARHDSENKHVLLSLRDNGCGMDTMVRSQIFTPFFTTRRAQGGTGLGLHMVYNWVHELLGGEIICVSEPGKGTEFRIVLPAEDFSSPHTVDEQPRENKHLM